MLAFKFEVCTNSNCLKDEQLSQLINCSKCCPLPLEWTHASAFANSDRCSIDGTLLELGPDRN